MIKLPLTPRQFSASYQDSVVLTPRGMSLSIDKEKAAASVRSWIRNHRSEYGWFHSFDWDTPGNRKDRLLVADQGWVMLALPEETEGILDVMLMEPVKGKERGDSEEDLKAWTWLSLCALASAPEGENATILSEIMAMKLEPLVGINGLIEDGFDVQLNLLAYALLRKTGREASTKKMALALEGDDLFGKISAEFEESSMESLVLSALLTQDPGFLVSAERRLYDPLIGGSRWEEAWRRSAFGASPYLAFAEVQLGWSGGRSESLLHMALSLLETGGAPRWEFLGERHIERESQMAHACALYLGITQHRGLAESWT